jgi:branched-chain amino acid aminotransferase
MESRYVWMDGKLVDYDKATLHFLTPALHYGAAVFEGIRSYETKRGPAIFRLREHIERLVQSAETFGVRELPFGIEELCAATVETVKANGFSSCYIRPLIYLSSGGWNLNLDTAKIGVGIAAWQWTNYLGEKAMEEGVRANVSSFTRHHPNVTMTKAKISGNYPNSILAKTESVRLGFDEAIMLDPDGYIAECTGQNIFIVRDGRITTPGTGAVLDGLTRDTLIRLAQGLGHEVREAVLSRDHLYDADEVFVCGTASECIALREIDFRKIGTGRMGPVTRALQSAYKEVVAGRHARSAEWLTYVEPAPAAKKSSKIRPRR